MSVVKPLNNTKSFDRALAYVKAEGLAIGVSGVIGLAQLLLEVARDERAKALEEAATLLLAPRCRAWSVAESALAIRTLDHPSDCSCHRWVNCGRPA